MSASSELTLEAVSSGYGETVVLENISFTIRQGERVGILGRNGAGKTTTLATIVGLAKLRSGIIKLDGQDISKLPTYMRSRAGIGYVPQTRDVFPTLTVEENLKSAMTDKNSAELTLAYDLFPRLKERRSNYGNQLSGGEQQMLAIARTLVTRPRILLLDEPLEGLAPRVREEVMTAIETLVAETNVGCLLVEQYVDVVLAFSDRVLVLERGSLSFEGTPADLQNDPATLDRTVGLHKIDPAA
jgi:branched-chain amino acid transport system ATP-binding protein